MKYGRWAAIAAVDVIALCLASGAHAQQAPASPTNTVPPATTTPGAQANSGLEEIIVTARRSSENQQKVPIFVSSFTGADLAAKGIASVQDLAQSAPNLYSVPNAGSSNAIAISLRGQAQRDNLLTLDPSVGVYVDDVYYARTYEVPANLLDVANVEVLNGPQGTLYGRNTTGGALKITTVTANPNGGFTGYVKGSYGNYNAVTVGGAINIPIIPGQLAIRYAGEYRNHDGYTTSYLVPTIGSGVPNAAGVATSLTPTRAIGTDNENSYSHRLSLRFTPTSDIKLDIAGSLFHAVDNGTALFNPYGDIENYNFTASPSIFSNSSQRKANFWSGLTDVTPFSRTDVKSLTGALEWHFSDAVTAKLIIGYVEGRSQSITNYDGTVNASLSFLQAAPALDQRQHQNSEEFQLKGTILDKKLDYVAGLYTFYEAGSEDPSGSSSIVLNSDITANPQFSANNRSRSAFGNLIYHITDSIRLNGGIRYNSDRKFIDASPRFAGDPAAFTAADTGAVIGFPGVCVLSAATPGAITSTTPGGPCSLTNTATFNYVTWEAGADYQVTPKILLYVKVNKGVRSGGENARLVNSQLPSSFQPETVINYEAGFKSELVDRHVRFNVSAFHDTLSNAQQSVIQTFGTSVTSIEVNQGSAKIDGFEGQLLVLPVNHLTLSASMGYNHFRYSNQSLVDSNDPSLTYTLSAIYDTPLSLGDMTARIDWNHVSSLYYDTTNVTPLAKLPGYGVLNGRLGLKLHDGLEIAAYGRNILNKEYYRGGSVSSANSGGPTPYFGTRGLNLGDPRTYGLEATLKF